MKSVKNDRASYRTRAVIGNPKAVGFVAGDRDNNRPDFVVDRNGYFIWPKSPVKERRK